MYFLFYIYIFYEFFFFMSNIFICFFSSKSSFYRGIFVSIKRYTIFIPVKFCYYFLHLYLAVFLRKKFTYAALWLSNIPPSHSQRSAGWSLTISSRPFGALSGKSKIKIQINFTTINIDIQQQRQLQQKIHI